jgi:ketosteroid isomerase-like protein
MSEENVETLRGVRIALPPLSERASQRRSLDERLFVRFPAASRLLAGRLMRLPPRSRLRRLMLARSALRGLAAVNRRDFEVFFLAFEDDIDYRPAQGALDDRGPIHGKDALRAHMQDWFDTFDNFRQEPVELIDAGEDQVIAVLRIRGRAKLSGVETDLTYAALYTFRDGKIARGREYWTRDEALEAAGLRE